MADEATQLVIELVGLTLELDEGIGATVAAQADAATEVLQLGEVVHPERVDGTQQDGPLDERPGLLTEGGLALLELRGGEVLEGVR